MLKVTACLFAALIGLASLSAAARPAPGPPVAPVEKHRVIILTDIENEPDDTESVIRLLLYSNQIDIEGLVATTSVHLKNRVAPESLHRILAAYARVQPNLLKHEAGFPEARVLAARVTQGLPVYGMGGVGEGKDSPGSAMIIRALESQDPRPLWVTAWGGANTLAQALYRIRADKTPEEAKRLIAKLRVYTISDQDDSGIWMRTQFPDLFYIVSPGGYGASTWSGIMQEVPDQDNTELSTAWIAEHIQQGHGPMGALYPDISYGMEGDTPSFLGLIPNGLNAPETPEWGGWGGRYEFYKPELSNMDTQGFTGGVPILPEPRAIWTNATDSYRPYIVKNYGRSVQRDEKTVTGFKTTVWRWRKAFQNDFAARMDWTTKAYADANHPPVPVLDHDTHLTVKSGSTFELSATGSSDPDGDSLSFLWFNYPEAGSWKTPIPINGAENIYRVHVTAPEVTKTETAHFILAVTDKGTPPLTRYKRVIVTIEP